MRPGGTAWTQDEIATVISMRRAGHHLADIAKVLGRSFDSVASKAANLRTIIEGPPAALVTAPARQFRTRSERITSQVMGDPPAGRSALDQRRA